MLLSSGNPRFCTTLLADSPAGESAGRGEGGVIGMLG